jgi:hypothetical protein
VSKPVDDEFTVMTAEAALTMAQRDGGLVWFAGRVADGPMWTLARSVRMEKGHGVISVAQGGLEFDRMRAKTEVYVRRHTEAGTAA